MENNRSFPLVSVILPTYNRAWCLARAVESVLDQDYEGFELIVVDDGSTDNTGDILSAFPSARVIRTANQGVSAARNLGVARSSGEWIAFLDSDDQWLPRKLRLQTAFLEDNPGLKICQTQETWIRNGRRVNPKACHAKQAGIFFERSLELCLVSPSAVMMEKKLFRDMDGFDESLPACEDYDLWLRIGLHHPIGLLDKALIIKQGGHQDQLSRAPGLDRYRIRSLARLLEKENLTLARKEAVIRVLQKKCSIYAAGCEKRGRLDEAARYRSLMRRYCL